MKSSSQLDLFAEPSAGAHAPAPVAPVRDLWPRARELAATLSARLRLGTSSWSFPGWLGLIYAPTANPRALSRYGLHAYAQHPLLRTVGIDSAYHAPVPIERLRAYAEQVPEDFRFLVKMPAAITDPVMRAGGGRPVEVNPGFLNPAQAIAHSVWPFVEGLGARGGVLLLQFPPLGETITANPRRFAEDLYRFLRRLPTGPHYAVEVRDQGLLTCDLVEALRHGGAQAALSLHARLPPLDRQQALFADLPPGPLVLRWMLRANRGYTEASHLYRPFDRLREPDPDARDRIARLVSAALDAGREVYVIVNNKAEGCAPLSLMALAETLSKQHG
ncbi:MAG: DUF72 domain-containing protein [Thermochromatium sp.]